MKWLSPVIEYSSYALIAFGAWLAWPPLGFIVAGVLLLQTIVGLQLPTRHKE